ncbi:MAG: hypothetical protein QXX30_01345 [Candidatus Aenigmatarchaeota archaeon]
MRDYFQKEEIFELFLSILLLSFIFSTKYFAINISKFFYYISIFLPIFVLKELIQKSFAKRLGYSSKFKLYNVSFILAFFVSFIGIKLAAPGYTELLPYKFSNWKFRRKFFSVEDEGKIIFVGLSVFIIFCIIVTLFNIKEIKDAFALILIFNLIPILPFDGTKILKWSFSTWSFLFILSVILLIL